MTEGKFGCVATLADGWPEEMETTSRIQYDTRDCSFVGGFRLGLRAARQLRCRRALALSVIALASLSYISSIAADGFYWRHCSSMSKAQWQRTRTLIWGGGQAEVVTPGKPARLPFARRWLSTPRSGLVSRILLSPTDAFGTPLSGPVGIANVWSICLGKFFPSILHFHQNALMLSAYFPLRSLWQLVPALAINTLFLAGLLAWLRDASKPLRLSDWPRCWRQHYAPLLGVGVLLVLAITVGLSCLDFISFRDLRPGTHLTPPGAGLREAVNSVLAVLFMLAPFAVVARRQGAGRGIITGLHLLRRNWLALIALFLLYRVGYEAITVWQAWSPWVANPASVGFEIGGSVIAWGWATYVASAVLGLWAAYALMGIAKGTEPQASTA